ncbi:MAG: PAS domain S-box protein [Desulfobacterales bacterium]
MTIESRDQADWTYSDKVQTRWMAENLADQLKESENRYQLLADNTLDVIWQMGLDFRLRYVNPAIFSVLGYTPEAFVGTRLQDHCSAAELDRLAGIIRQQLDEPDAAGVVLETVLKHRDGHSVPVEIHGKVLRGDHARPVGFQGTARDITQQRKTLDSLRENEEKFRRLFNLISDAVFLIENDSGRIVEVNEAASRQYGFTHDELIGLKHTDLFVEPSASVRAAVNHLTIEPVRHRKKDGTVFPVDIAATHFEWKGKAVHLAAIRDVSARLRAEREKAELENQLRQAQKLEAIGRLAGGVAHDFNNLLSAIIGFTGLMLGDIAPDHPNHDLLEEIHAAGLRGRDLTKNLLAFGRKQVFDVKVLDLNEVVSRFERLIRRVIGEDIELRLRLSPDAGRVVADVSQLEQVLMNLAINSRDAMPGGGILRIETDAARVDGDDAAARFGLSPGSYALITVSDNGSGIEPRIQDQIFEPFFTTKRHDRGTGLGLATVYGIVKQHGGNIQVCSETGKGATFRIYLPGSTEATIEAPEPSKPLGCLKGTETILLVEDDPAILRLVRRILEGEGYRVIAPENPGAAVQAAVEARDPIDLLLTDVIMPGLNGAEVRERVTAAHPGIKVLFMSGYTQGFLASHGIRMGANRLVHKPFTKDGLLQNVRSALHGC